MIFINSLVVSVCQIPFLGVCYFVFGLVCVSKSLRIFKSRIDSLDCCMVMCE